MDDECSENKSESIDGPDIYPDEDELPGDTPDIDNAPVAHTDIDADTIMEFAWKDWFESTTPEERNSAVYRHGAPDIDNLPDTVEIPDDLDLTDGTDESE